MTRERALAKLCARAVEIDGITRVMRAAMSDLPLPIQVEVNNIQECVDLLRHKLREETLRRVVYRLPSAPVRKRRRS